MESTKNRAIGLYEAGENEVILKALDKAKARLNANVSFDLTIELLLLTIKENSNI